MNGREIKKIIDTMTEEELDKGWYFMYPSGDYWNTAIAGDITRIDDGYAEWSDYHHKMTVADEPEPDEDDENLTDEEYKEKLAAITEKFKKVMILS